MRTGWSGACPVRVLHTALFSVVPAFHLLRWNIARHGHVGLEAERPGVDHQVVVVSERFSQRNENSCLPSASAPPPLLRNR